MAEKERAKHAFGTLENIDSALSKGTIDAYDILFVKDVNGKPYVGWIDKDGNKVICDDSAEIANLESQIATKVGADEVDAKIEVVVTEKVTEKVETKIDEAMDEKVEDAVNTAKEYTDTKIAEAMEESYGIIEF